MTPPITALQLLALFASSSLLVASLLTGPTQSAPPSEGEQIFKKSCAKCHGDKGLGGPAYPKPLVGTLAVADLAAFIHKSMPPGDKKLTAVQARKVAEYIHGAFYSPLAQERNRPARVSLSRLTVKQYRNAVADLLTPWSQVVPGKPGGLKGEYFRNRAIHDPKQKLMERIDPQVDFDFGREAPGPGDYDPYRFSVVWQGSVFAPDTGDYELVLRANHAARMWINGMRQPVVDGWVRAKDDKEFRGSVHLLGGRAYPVRIEFSKAVTGVDDPNKKPDHPPGEAAIALLWKRPRMAEEPIPSRFLYAESAPPTYVPATPFPADDRSIGYDRGTSVSQEWLEATTAAALEAASTVSSRLNELAGTNENDPQRAEKVRALCRRFVERAFRRPLDADALELYVERQFRESKDLESAVKRVVILTLKSPRFLYRESDPKSLDAYDIASELALGLWDTIPDAELLNAAAQGRLDSPEEIEAQANRMAEHPRAWNKLRDFLLFWLKVDDVPDLVKNPKRYPAFDEAVATDLRSSLEMFLERAAWQSSDYRKLFLDQEVFLNGRLAKLYLVDLPEKASFRPVKLDAQRYGVLTHPYLLSRLAYLETSSPIHRGVLIARSMLGRTLQPPPAAFTPLAPSLHPKLTTRERVALQTKPSACRSCHDLINPLGFTLERFDAIGRLRSVENGKPVDASGSYETREGKLVKFKGVADLAKFVATSDEAHGAFAEKLFHHLVKQPVLAYGPKTLPELKASFAKSDYSIRKLMAQIMVRTLAPATAAKGAGARGASQ